MSSVETSGPSSLLDLALGGPGLNRYPGSTLGGPCLNRYPEFTPAGPDLYAGSSLVRPGLNRYPGFTPAGPDLCEGSSLVRPGLSHIAEKSRGIRKGPVPFNFEPTPGRNGQGGGQYHTEIARRLPWSCSSSSMVMEYSHFPCPLYTGFGFTLNEQPGAFRSGCRNHMAIRRIQPGDNYVSPVIFSDSVIPFSEVFAGSRSDVRSMPLVRRKPDLRPAAPIRPRRGFGVGSNVIPVDFNRSSFTLPGQFPDFTSIHPHLPCIPRSLPCPS